MIHIKERERDLTIDISFAIRITGLIQCETDGRIGNDDDLHSHFGVAWQVTELNIVEFLLTAFFIQFLKEKFFALERDVLTEQLRFRIAIFRDTDIS